MCRPTETQFGYVAAIVQLILQQGDYFDFSSVEALLDPSSLTIASFLDMFQLERLLFLKLFRKLSPLKPAEAAFKRADRLAAVSAKVQKLEQPRSSELNRVADIEQRRLMWEASLAQRPEDMGEYAWNALQRQLSPLYNSKKAKKSQRKPRQKNSLENSQPEKCAVVADSAAVFSHTDSSTYYSDMQTPTLPGRNYTHNVVPTMSAAAAENTMQGGLDSSGGRDGDGGGSSGVQGLIGPARGQGKKLVNKNENANARPSSEIFIVTMWLL